MALPAIPLAVKAVILAAKDERTRTAVLTLVAGIVLAIVLPILLLFSVLLSPMSPVEVPASTSSAATMPTAHRSSVCPATRWAAVPLSFVIPSGTANT